eukprot:jgi/Tetstr1/457663/TSEL_004244.t1
MRLDEDPRFQLVRTACMMFAKEFPDYELETTGHSMGGSLAIWAAAPLRSMAVAFNPGLVGDPLCTPDNTPVVFRVDGDIVSGGAKAQPLEGRLHRAGQLPLQGRQDRQGDHRGGRPPPGLVHAPRARTAMRKLYAAK